MMKYILELTDDILEINYDDFIPLFFANYSSKNKKIFDSSESISEFMVKLDVDDPIIEKEFYLIESQLREQNIQILLKYYDEIMETLANKTLTLEAIKHLDTEPLIKCLYQSIYHFKAADDDIFEEKSTAEDLEYTKKWLKKHQSFLDYLFIFYEYNQLMKENKKSLLDFKIIFENYLEDALLRFSTGKYQIKISQYKEKIENLENNISHLEKIIEKKKSKNLKIREKMKKMKDDHSIEISNLKSKMQERISEIKEYMKALEGEIQEVKKVTIPKEKYEKKREEARKYLAELNELNQEYTQLKTKEKSFEVNLTTVEHYLKENGITKEFHQLISLYDDSLITGKVSPHLIQRHFYKIGYVSIEIDGHYFIDAYQEKSKLLSLPKEVYLENQQLIAVSINNIFIKTFNQIYNDEVFDDFTLNEVASSKPLKVHGPKETLIAVDSSNELFEPGDIVRIDSDHQITGKLLKRIDDSLSAMIPSIQAKKHQLIYLHKKYTSGTLAYDLINKEELIFSKTFDVLEHAIITIENDELIKRFKFSKYLEDKKILKDLTVGYYLEDGGHQWIEFTNSKRLPLSEFQVRGDNQLKNGDVLGIDLFNNVIKCYDSNSDEELTDEQKMKKYQKTQETDYEKPDYTVRYEKEFLIIGNEKLGQRYIESFKENGIKVDFVPGHESYYKIQSKANQCDEILFITTAASHTNFYNLKKDYFDKLTFINYQGVNRLLDYILDERL